MPEISGLIGAPITPRDKHGELDLGAAFELVDFLCRAGLQGIALFTAAGEYSTLAVDERSRLTYLAVKRSRIPVIAAIGAATLDHSVQLGREARDAGASALLLPPPFFLQCDADDIREFYLQFAARIGPAVPTYLVNTPPLTPAIDPSVARELLTGGLFAGIVESTSATDPSLTLAGSDRHFLEMRLAGVRGAISEIACIAPELMLALDCAISRNRSDLAELLNVKMQEASAWLNEFPQPAALKTATHLRGLKTGPETAAAPLTPAKLKRMDEFREWFPQWLASVQKMAADA